MRFPTEYFDFIHAIRNVNINNYLINKSYLINTHEIYK